MQMKMFNKSFWKIRKKRKSYAVTPKPTMISPSERKTPIKIAGYLEKKSKMRVVCRWKKQWFVLEGRLLLYYKSQLEYLSLSPCRGTVNMGLAASVIPGKSNEIIVSTRSHSVSLRALNRSDHDIWLQALMDAMCLPNSNHTLCYTKPVHHFRYSTGGLDHLENKVEIAYNLTNHANTLSGQLSPLYVKTSPNISVPSIPIKSKSLIGRENIPECNSIDIHRKTTLQNSLARGLVHDGKDYKVEKLAKKFSKVAVSDTSIPGKFKVTSNDSMKANLLRRSLSVEEEVNRYSENIYESLKDVNKFESNIISKQTRKFVNRVNRSDSDCLMMIREKMNKSHTHFRSEQRIKTTGSSPLPIYERFGETFYNKKTDKPNNGDAIEKLWKLKMKYSSNSRQNYEKEAKSDTDLSVRKHRSTMEESRNYGALYKNTALSKRNSESYDFSNLQEIIKEKTKGPVPLPGAIRSRKTSRSNSILRTLTRMKSSDKSSGDLVKRNSMKKRSLSFLKKMWKRKDTKWEVDSFSSEINNFHEMQGPSSDFDNMSDFSTNDLGAGYDLPQPEPPPDYDQVNGSDEELCQGPPELPPRFHHTRSASPCHDVPSNNKPVDPEPPPALPIKVRKLRKKNSHALDFLFHENSDPGLRYLFQEEEYIQENGKQNKDKELGEILTKLNEMNNAPLASFHLYENGQNSFGAKRNKDEEDPDYDIPRPHVSLLSTLRKQSCSSDSLPATHFFSQYEDSLDVTASRDRFEEFTMAPDSLECDPWSLSNEGEAQSESWSLSCDHRKSISDNLIHDNIYQDSLNPPISHRLNEYMHLQTGYIQLHS